jgi:hypothetical protein
MTRLPQIPSAAAAAGAGVVEAGTIGPLRKKSAKIDHVGVMPRDRIVARMDESMS